MPEPEPSNDADTDAAEHLADADAAADTAAPPPASAAKAAAALPEKPAFAALHAKGALSGVQNNSYSVRACC